MSKVNKVKLLSERTSGVPPVISYFSVNVIIRSGTFIELNYSRLMSHGHDLTFTAKFRLLQISQQANCTEVSLMQTRGIENRVVKLNLKVCFALSGVQCI